jgi:prolipoprotein diacylglyceryl transferase
VTVASIPSPRSGVVHLGPLTIHMYGLMILAGILACVWVAGIRWTRRGGEFDLVVRVALWGVAWGVVGARLYHDLTSWDEVPHTWWGWAAIWQGGLGIWGGIAFGAVAGAVVVRRAGARARDMLDVAAPALLVAQAIGRIGNWWNQELYGSPTTLPWALRIDPEHRQPRYETFATFHPTFLYELVWNLLGAVVLVLVDRRFRLRPPALFALYVAWYCAFRTYEETLRIDPAHHVFGQRLNFWVSLVVCLAACAFFAWWQEIRPRAAKRPALEGVRPSR